MDIVWSSLNSWLHSLLLAFVGKFEAYFVHPWHPQPTYWMDYLFGNSLGLSYIIAGCSALGLAALAVFVPNLFRSTGQALGIALLIATLGPYYFGLVDWLYEAGNQLTAAMIVYHPPDNAGMIGIPSFSNVLASIVAFVLVALTGGTLMVIFVIFEVIIIIVKFALLPLLPLWPVGNWAKTKVDSLIALGLVATLTGRPIGVFIIDVGKALSDSIEGPGQPSFIGTVILVASFVTAVVVEIKLFKVTKRVVSRVSNGIRANVRGDVNANQKKPTAVNAQAAQAAHNAGVRPLPTAAAAGFGGFLAERARDTKNWALAKGALAVATKVGASVTPTGRAVAVGANLVAKRYGAKPIELAPRLKPTKPTPAVVAPVPRTPAAAKVTVAEPPHPRSTPASELQPNYAVASGNTTMPGILYKREV